MNFDKNTVIGFLLLMVLLFGYIFFTNKEQTSYLNEKKRIEDSVARVKDSLTKTGGSQKKTDCSCSRQCNGEGYCCNSSGNFDC
jgi:hypothetical protein